MGRVVRVHAGRVARGARVAMLPSGKSSQDVRVVRVMGVA